MFIINLLSFSICFQLSGCGGYTDASLSDYTLRNRVVQDFFLHLTTYLKTIKPL